MLLFKMALKHSAGVLSSVPKVCCALWRKYMCYINFIQVLVIMLLAMMSMLIIQQHILDIYVNIY